MHSVPTATIQDQSKKSAAILKAISGRDKKCDGMKWSKDKL